MKLHFYLSGWTKYKSHIYQRGDWRNTLHGICICYKKDQRGPLLLQHTHGHLYSLSVSCENPGITTYTTSLD